jgi:hypothetical protein
MPQTILALVAVFILSTYSLSQLRNTAAIERRSVQREIELVAGDVARERLAEITERVFDQADAAGSSLRLSTAGLTQVADMGPDAGETGPALYNDVDDFHQADGSALADSADWDGGTLYFDVMITVRYVDPADPDAVATSPTLAKEVLVTVAERPTGTLRRRPAVTQLRAIVSAAAQRPI